MSSAARFALDGAPYTMTPTIPIRETAALDVLRALQVILVGGTTTDACNAKIANTLRTTLGRPYHSRRYVQKGVTLLARAGVILRRWVDVPAEWGVRNVRQIVLVQTFAGNAEARRKAKKANDLGPKNFSPPRAPSGAGSARPRAVLSKEREQEEATRAGAADAGGGAPSSSPAKPDPDAGGEGPKPTPEELAAFFRQLARGGPLVKDAPAGPPPAPPTPRGPRRERPVEPAEPVEDPPEEPPADPIVRGVWEARRAAIAAATAEQLADLAAMGDRAARAELNRRHRLEVEAARLEAVTRPAVEGLADPGDPIPAPRVDPPDPSPAAIAPGRPEVRPRGRDSPDPPRRGFFGRLFGRG